MDELLKKIASLGTLGIVLIVAIGNTGLVGAAAITAGLASLGGPFGMLGGIFALGLVALITHTVSEYGLEAVIKAVVREQQKTKSTQTIIREINGYPITKGLKLKIIDYVSKY